MGIGGDKHLYVTACAQVRSHLKSPQVKKVPLAYPSNPMIASPGQDTKASG